MIYVIKLFIQMTIKQKYNDEHRRNKAKLRSNISVVKLTSMIDYNYPLLFKGQLCPILIVAIGLSQVHN